MTLLALSFLNSGVAISMGCAVAGLVFAFVLIFAVTKSSPGNARMKEIAGAIQEGAKAYLNRQVITISSIAIIIFILLFFFKDHATAVGFIIGAACSLAAGYIGMRIAVLANVRTTEAATRSCTSAMRVAFNGGAVTGLLVVGLDADGATALDDLELATDPIVVVVGSEGRGLSRLVGETCDLTVSIPMAGPAESLNASVAAAVTLAEIARRRRA